MAATIPPTCDNDGDTVLVHLVLTGASGYLGQHLLSQWITKGLGLEEESPGAPNRKYKTKITALYNRSEGFPGAVERFCSKSQNKGSGRGVSDVAVRSIDLTNADDVRSFVESSLLAEDSSPGHKTTVFNVVVHSAALSSPRVCQEDPDRARAVNVPRDFFDAVLGTASASRRTAIVALSTDQVYDGTRKEAFYTETETKGLEPVNAYGQTKLEMEKLLLRGRDDSPMGDCFALRSSIILGPPAPIDPGCAHGTFLDFCRSRGETENPTTFFTNEYRSVVRVDRVLDTVRGIVVRRVLLGRSGDRGEKAAARVVYNMGGPCRVHRLDMARAVFDKFGYDPKLLLATDQTSPHSPLDISMDSSLLFRHGILAGSDDKTQGLATESYLKALVDYAFPDGEK